MKSANNEKKYTDKNRQRDFDYYVKNLSRLYKQYGRCYLVIRNKTILGSYRTIESALKATQKEYPLGSFIVQKCGPDESAYSVRIMSFAFSGMDVISKGDFSVTNVNRKTSFSFRIPSKKRIDYMQEPLMDV